MIVAIHQPNFFPWLGYFDKIARADVFVFLDQVDFPKNSWVNRVKVRVQGRPHWLTCPVQRATTSGAIADVLMDDGQDWRRRISSTLQANYARTPQFAPAQATITSLLNIPENRLAEFNIRAIEHLATVLGIKTRFVRQSSLSVSGASNTLLARLVKECGGSTYLMGGGATGYHDNKPFLDAGVEVAQQQFEPFVYGPEGSFVSGLSVIDYLMLDGRPFSRLKQYRQT